MKNKKALLVFSHQLTENQEKELVEEYGVKEIERLPEELQNMWSNVSIKKDYKENLEFWQRKYNFNTRQLGIYL